MSRRDQGPGPVKDLMPHVARKKELAKGRQANEGPHE